MKKLVLTALCALAFGACGDDGGGDTGIVVTPDGGTGDGDGGTTAACNPVTQAGCEAGQKCAQLVASDEPFLASTACVPDGTVTDGGACMRGEAGPNGYDDCVAGYDCLRGECVQICTSAGGDTCRATPDPGFGEGSYCTLYADLFSDEIGLCVPGCNPTDDAIVTDNVVNAKCGEGNGCYLNIGRGVAACAGTPEGAVGVAQNEDCYGPAAGSCYLNGCDSGYSPILPNAVGEAATTNTCSRYCTPVDTFIGSNADADGAASKCETGALVAAGSGAQAIVHECRFIQSLYGEPLDPASQGMCVPIDPWYNCGGTYDFTGMSDAVLNAADMAAANTAFNIFCYGEAEPPDTAEILAKCDGLGFGCTSLATRQPLFDKLDGTSAGPANTPEATRAWLKARLQKAPTQAIK